jgi:hypothetical protein
MNATLTETNLQWVEATAKTLNVPPEAILNAILDHLRQKDKTGGQRLTEWIDAAGRDHVLTAELHQEVVRTITEVQDAVNGTQVYLSLLQQNQKSG